MFEFVRTHKKWMQILLALLIIPSFIFVGVDSYSNSSAGATEVATVGGAKITQQEWEDAQRKQMDRYRGMLGDRFDPKMFESAETKQAILENLVAERALDAEIKKSHMTIGDAALAHQIGQMEAFKKPDGSFDMDQYKTTLAQQGLSPRAFDALMRRDLAVQQLNTAVQSSAFAPRTVAARLSEIGDQEREVQELILPASDFVSQVKVTDEMVKAFYDKNTTLFQVPEQAKVEYIALTAADVERQVTVADAEVADFYKANVAKMTTPEKRTASHILVTVKPGASAADKAAAKAKAAAIAAELQKAPATFAAVAKAQSQDPASAELGGDLGEMVKGNQDLPAPIVNAVFGMKQGEVGNPVESEFGYHVITVTNVKPSVVKPLEEAKAEILAELKKSKMSKKYSDLAVVFTETVEDQFDSLKPAADKLGLKIETVDKLTRTPSPALGDSPANNPKFLAAVFADDTLKTKRNTRAVEAGNSTLIAGRVVEYKPASKRPLAEVDAVIRQRVVQEEAAKMARKAGEAKLAAAKASKQAEGFGPAKVVTRSAQPPIPPAAALAVLKADVTALPAYVGVDVPGIGYGVYRINKVAQPAAPDMARRASEIEQINSAVAQQEMFTFTEALKSKAKVKMLAKPVVTADAK